MMKKCSWCNKHLGLLILRIGVGAIFIMTGWMKAADMTHTIAFFTQIGFNAFWAYVATAVELLGGIAVLLGIYTQFAAPLLAIVMLVATYLLRKDLGAVITPVSLLCSTLALTFIGSGKYSLMRGCCGGCNKTCGNGTCGTCSTCVSNNTAPKM